MSWLRSSTEWYLCFLWCVAALFAVEPSGARAQDGGITPVPFGRNSYEFIQVTDPFTGRNNAWDVASAAASARVFRGVAGHLATIESQAENDFLLSLAKDRFITKAGAWLGGRAPQGWLEGPSQGQPFGYVNWGGMEPNNSGYAYMCVGLPFARIAQGKWADDSFVQGVPDATFDPVVGYFVEYEGTAGLPPSAEAGPDQVVEQTGLHGTSVTLDGSASSDPDGDPLTYTWTGPFGTVTGPTPTVSLQLGTSVATLLVDDGKDGTSTDIVRITVRDTTPPVVTAPAGVVVEQANGDGTPVHLAVPLIADICDAAPVLTNDAPAVFPLGETIVTWTARDASGNTATATQAVTVVDTTPPEVIAPPLLTLEQSSRAGTPVPDCVAPWVIKRIPTGGNPGVIPLIPSLNRLYAGMDPARSVAVVDTALLRKELQIPTAGYQNNSIDVNPVTKRVYVAQQWKSSVLVWDAVGGCQLADVPFSGRSAAIRVNPAANELYVVRQAQKDVVVLNCATHSFSGPLPLGETIEVKWSQGMAIDHATGRILLVDWPRNRVVVVDMNTKTKVTTFAAGNNPSGIAIDPLTRKVFVTNYNEGTVSVVHADTYAVLATITTGGSPLGVDVNPGRAQAYVTDNTGARMWVIDGRNNTVRHTVPVGPGLNGVSIHPQTNEIFVAGTGQVVAFSEAWTARTADICDAAPVVTNDAPAVFPLGQTTVTWTARDASGHSATAMQTATVVDTTPPTITGPAHITVEQQDRDGTDVNVRAQLTVTDICDAQPVTVVSPSGPYPLGTTPVTVTSTDASGNRTSLSLVVEVRDTTPPQLDGSIEVIAEQTNRDGTPVPVLAEHITVSDICDAAPILTVDPPGPYPLGVTLVTVTAIDASGNRSTHGLTVQIVDTTPPVMTNLSATPDTLWAPNHQMVEVVVGAQLRDICDAAPTYRIVAVSCNEAVNAKGDGNTGPDWVITGAHTVHLRAERSGSGAGRVYTLTVEARDASGNTTTGTVSVKVSHDQGKKK